MLSFVSNILRLSIRVEVFPSKARARTPFITIMKTVNLIVKSETQISIIQCIKVISHSGQGDGGERVFGYGLGAGECW